MSAPQLLRHLHLPSVTPFSHASAIQSKLDSQFLAHKALVSSSTPPSPPPPAPIPTLITFNSTPVYTTGRRELGTLTASQINLLKEPLFTGDRRETADVVETLRGGQITFHGPGQLVIYPILDLKAIKSEKWPKGLSVRCYVNLLEEATIRALSHYGIHSERTEHPGVWADEKRKIAALGVHLRRNITSYGVGLNIGTDLRWFDRIVACGLEGKETTSLMEEKEIQRGSKHAAHYTAGNYKEKNIRLHNVANIWAQEFAKGLWGSCNPLRKVDEDEKAWILDGIVRKELEDQPAAGLGEEMPSQG